VGPSNLLTLLASIPPYWAPIKKIFNVRLGDADDPADLERLKEMSPLNSAARIRAPLLVIQGANDPRVNKAESEQIVVSLRDRGRPVEYLLAPDEGHGFAGRENRLAVAAAMEKFFAAHVGGRYQETMPQDIAAKLAALTVDVKAVVVSKAPPGGAAMAGETVTSGDGTALSAVTLEYAGSFTAGGREQKVQVTRTIGPADFQGRAVWRVVTATTMTGMSGADTLDLDRATLRPVRREAAGGGGVTLTFTETGVNGEIRMGAQKMPVSATGDGPIFCEGAGLDVLLASLPLAPGYEATARVFEVLPGKVRPMKLAVTGSETVTTGAGTFETFVLQVTPTDGDESGTATLHVTMAAPHVLVKSTTRLPAMMGGGTATAELVGRK
jgi:hypothetical protein